MFCTGEATDDPEGRRWARIVEVTRTTPAEEVFELVIEDEPPTGGSAYRATRLPSLYVSDIQA